MPPATAIVDVAGGDALGGEHHGLESGAAHLVDGQGGNGVGEARVQRRLARGSLAQSGRHHVAQDAFLDGTRLHAGAAHGFPHDERAELRRGESLTAPPETVQWGGEPPTG